MTPADHLLIREMPLQARIGVGEPERSRPQALVLTLRVYLDLAVVGVSDRIGDTVDYAELMAAIDTHVAGSERHTLEALAHDIAALCLQRERVRRVDLELGKVALPDLPGRAAVAISRTRGA
jgi:FolB domain-containing protein